MPGLSTTPPSWRSRALRVDHGHVEPAVVGPEARGPHDRADLAAAQVELPAGGRGHPGRRDSARAGRGRRRRRCARAQSSKESSRRSSLRSASENTLRSPPENSARPSRTAAHRPDQLDAQVGERVEVERSRARGYRPAAARAAAGPGSGRRPRRTARPTRPTGPSTTARRVRDRYAAAGRARRPRGSPAGPIAPARRPAVRRSPTLRPRGRRRREAGPGCGSRRGSAGSTDAGTAVAERRHRRPVEGAARDDHGPAVDLAVAGRHVVSVVGAAYRRHGRCRCGPGPARVAAKRSMKSTTSPIVM